MVSEKTKNMSRTGGGGVQEKSRERDVFGDLDVKRGKPRGKKVEE